MKFITHSSRHSLPRESVRVLFLEGFSVREELETGAVLDAISRAQIVGTKELIRLQLQSSVPATKSCRLGTFVGRIDRELQLPPRSFRSMHEHDVLSC